ncbi:DCC-interacting protein 13-alpha-like isoform X3 [Tubulanus polymorphus]|uniref:DCC-interacting protein 13-alpha-like isoform X3 n=1 Tax=Tubulanus polymorphus TaxID=672921 RepID=UPI003DA52293
MPGIERLHLEEALEDSPQTRSLLGVFENDADILGKYAKSFHQCCDRIHRAQSELSAATQALSQLLKNYEKQRFPLESDDSILTSTIMQFSTYLDEISSMQQVLATQLADSMMYPVTRFLHADLDEIQTMGEMFQVSTQEHEQAVAKYMKIPRKRDNEKQRFEGNEELYVMKKKFHQTALHYYSSLNAIQYKRKYAFLEPLLGYMHAHRSFFQLCNEAIVRPETEEMLSNISASVQGVHQEMNQEIERSVEFMNTLEHQCNHLYYAEPVGDMPYIPPNLNLTQKAGYLFMRSKTALFASSWDRSYFFIQGGNLMSQSKAEVAGGLVLDLNEEGLHAEPADADDRRFIFHIVAPSTKKTVILQAENERERDEWIATVNNIVKEGGYVKDKVLQPVKKRVASVSSKPKHDSPNEASRRRPHSITGIQQSHSSPTSPDRSPVDNFLYGTPIQFDMISPSDEGKSLNPKEGPPRINPFDQSSDALAEEGSEEKEAAYCQTYVVRFLGSMEVAGDRGEALVHETIRQIMAARAIHNIFKMMESHLVITNKSLKLLDPANKNVRTEFALEDISYWCAHNENKRLFAFITRNKAGGGEQPTFACHVFECNATGEEICQSISGATKVAFHSLMERRSKQKMKVQEKELLLANINSLEDRLDEEDEASSLQLSPDGKFLVLDDKVDSTTEDELLDNTNGRLRCESEA